jgi:ribonuclease HI
LRALETVDVGESVRIFTDSKYSINCVTVWYENWEKNRWQTKNGPVKNKDLVVEIRERIVERNEVGSATLFQWVKGHNDTPGNVEADKLAVAGSGKPRVV